MRIAYITETFPPEINGVSLTVERTVRFLRGRGHDVDLIRPRQPHEGPLASDKELRTAGVPIPMYKDLRFGLARVAPLRERFERHQPMVVHIATPGPLAWAAMRAAHSLGIPTTTDFRTNFHVYSHYYRLSWLSPLILRALRGFHNGSQRTHVPTVALREELTAAGFQNVETIGRGVDTNAFSPAHRQTSLREELGVHDAPLLLYVGRLAAEKNVELALQAFDAVRIGMPTAGMVVVGDGPMRAYLERRYPHVHFAGMQTGEALARHYASADLFLFPSLTDTFGNVVPEALASGVPVLAFATGAAKELVQPSCAGRVIPVGETEHFITAACSMAWQYRHAMPMRTRARSVALGARWDTVLTAFETSLMEVAYALRTSGTRQARAA